MQGFYEDRYGAGQARESASSVSNRIETVVPGGHSVTCGYPRMYGFAGVDASLEQKAGIIWR